jgi:hypothetical protein
VGVDDAVGVGDGKYWAISACGSGLNQNNAAANKTPQHMAIRPSDTHRIVRLLALSSSSKEFILEISFMLHHPGLVTSRYCTCPARF